MFDFSAFENGNANSDHVRNVMVSVMFRSAFLYASDPVQFKALHCIDPVPWIRYMMVCARGELAKPFPPSPERLLADWAVGHDPLYFRELTDECDYYAVCCRLTDMLMGAPEYQLYRRRRYNLQALLD